MYIKTVVTNQSEVGRPKSEAKTSGFKQNTNTMKFKFEKLIIWQKAIEYGENINKLSYKFPKEENYNLSSQIRRAVDSIALNISEGSSRILGTNPEFKKFMGYAICSLAEKVTKRKPISKEEFNEHYEYAFNLMNMMVAFKGKIN